MQTVSLTWQQAGEVGLALTAVGAALAVPKDRRLRLAGSFLREGAIIAFLYGLWQRAGEIAGLSVNGAQKRAHLIQRLEHDVYLPSEHAVQSLVLGHRYVVETLNLYYDTMHFTMMFVFLLWLFWRHREHYRPVRQVLAWTTLFCLLVQLVPVAPPRLADPRIVDTAKLYGQSVYNGPAFDQLSAMPSVHVAWAMLVGFYIWRISPSRWRFIGPLHTVVTVFVVLSTGNHWWADGIVATALLVLAAWWARGLRWAAARVRQVARGRAPSWLTARPASAVPAASAAATPEPSALR